MEELVTLILALGAGFLVICLLIGIISLIAFWKIFEKCGKPGWVSLIPLYSSWVYFEICGLPGWLILIPFANIIGMLFANYKLAEKFGKGTGFGIGLALFLPIFMPILAFGKAMPIGSKREEVPSVNLMAPDPVQNGTVNLMTPDPMSGIQNSIVPEKREEFMEMPGLENQLEQKPEVIVPTPVEQYTTPVAAPVREEVPSVSAFEMPMPALKEEVNSVNAGIEKLHNTQKFCSICGNPNDALSKFCISCGHEFS